MHNFTLVRIVLLAYFIFSHACTEIGTFLAETREENPLFGVYTKNISQKIRQRQFCTNCWFPQRWSWLPILSSFRNELNVWSVRWRHLMVQKNDKKITVLTQITQLFPYIWELITSAFFVCTPKRGFSSRVSAKKSAYFCASMRKRYFFPNFFGFSFLGRVLLGLPSYQKALR